MHRAWELFFKMLLVLIRTLERLLRLADREPYYRQIVVLRRRTGDAERAVSLSAGVDRHSAVAEACAR